jgi:hypothetical protein
MLRDTHCFCSMLKTQVSCWLSVMNLKDWPDFSNKHSRKVGETWSDLDLLFSDLIHILSLLHLFPNCSGKTVIPENYISMDRSAFVVAAFVNVTLHRFKPRSIIYTIVHWNICSWRWRCYVPSKRQESISLLLSATKQNWIPSTTLPFFSSVPHVRQTTITEQQYCLFSKRLLLVGVHKVKQLTAVIWVTWREEGTPIMTRKWSVRNCYTMLTEPSSARCRNCCRKCTVTRMRPSSWCELGRHLSRRWTSDTMDFTSPPSPLN